MDEQTALIVILDAMTLAKRVYESLLFDKIQNEKNYQSICGLSDLKNAIKSCRGRINEIEDSE